MFKVGAVEEDEGEVMAAVAVAGDEEAETVPAGRTPTALGLHPIVAR